MTMSHLHVCSGYVRAHSALWKDALIVIGSSILIGLVARISIPLPFTPIPLSLGPQAVLFVALALGSVRGSLAALLYVLEGVMGLPVFSQGKCGMLALIGPTGGYIVGYIAGAYLTGYVAERLKEKRASNLFIALASGNALIYLFGAAWLARFVGGVSALTLGVLPFIVMDFIKTVSIARLFSYFGFKR